MALISKPRPSNKFSTSDTLLSMWPSRLGFETTCCRRGCASSRRLMNPAKVIPKPCRRRCPRSRSNSGEPQRSATSQKRPPRTLPSSPERVRFHAPNGIPTHQRVPCTQGLPQRLPRPAGCAPVTKGKTDDALTVRIRDLFAQSMGIYGSPRIFCDLRQAGVACGENREARLCLRRISGLYAAISVPGTKWVSQHLLRQSSYNASFSTTSLTNLGCRISPTSAPIKVGCNWRSHWTCTYVQWWTDTVFATNLSNRQSQQEFERQRQTSL